MNLAEFLRTFSVSPDLFLFPSVAPGQMKDCFHQNEIAC